MVKKCKYIYAYCAILIFTIVFTLLCACACQANNNDVDLGDTSNLDLVEKGALTVGIAPGFAPFESYIDGKIQGIDVDIAEMIAKDLKLKTSYKTIKYENILDAVKRKEVDIAISAIDVTPEKKKLVSFSSPYYSDEKVLIAKNNSAINKNNVDQYLQNSNTKIACVKTSTAEDYINANYNQLKKHTYNTNKEILDALNNNECEVALVYKSVLDVYPDTGLTIVKKLADKDECAIAIEKSNTSLFQLINKDISIRNSDGTITKIINKWIYNNK